MLKHDENDKRILKALRKAHNQLEKADVITSQNTERYGCCDPDATKDNINWIIFNACDELSGTICKIRALLEQLRKDPSRP